MTTRHPETRPVRHAMVLAVLALVMTTSVDATAKNCGGTPTCNCNCGDTVTSNCALNGPLTMAGTNAFPCTTSFGLRVNGGVTVTGKSKADAIIKGSSSKDTNGIEFLGAGATVTNVTVLHWMWGVLFEDGATGNTLSNSTIRANKRAGTASFYGINFKGDGNTVTDCAIKRNGDEGVHFSPGANDNTLTRSLVKKQPGEQVYLLTRKNLPACSGNHIVDNMIDGTGGLDSLNVDAANNNEFKGNVFKGAPVTFTAGASGNTFGAAGSCTAPCGKKYGRCVQGSCDGNQVIATHLLFQNGCLSDVSPGPCGPTPTYFAANNNTVRNADIDNPDHSCVFFKEKVEGAPLPFGNVVRDSKLTAHELSNEHEIIVDGVESSDTPPSPNNRVCASICTTPTGGTPPTACVDTLNDVNGDPAAVNVVTVSATCP